MKKLFTLLLTAVLLVVGGGNVWAETVGTPGTGDAWGARKHSTPKEVQVGQTLHYVFTNTSYGSEVWNNYLLEVTNGAGDFTVAGDVAATYYMTLRADNYGWGDAYDGTTFTGTFDGELTKAATIDMYVTFSSDKKVTTQITATNGESSYTKTNTSKAIDATSVFVSLAEELAVLDITTAEVINGGIFKMPYSTDFSSLNPFVGGSVVNGTNVQSVFNVFNTTAEASFNVDNSGTAYTLSANEEVTVSFKAYHGWNGSAADQTVSLLNSDGVVLASYTYALTSSNLVGVTVAGEPQTFTAYNCQSNKGNGNANGLTNNAYSTLDNNNPIFTFVVSQSGRCTVNVKYGLKNIDNTYTANVASGVKLDIAKITISCPNNKNNNSDRTICIDNLSISSVINETPKADFTIKYVDEGGNEIKEQTAGNDEVGATPTIGASDKATFVSGENKYVYASDDASSKTIAQDGSTVVTVTFNTLHKYNYSVTNSLGDQIANGSIFTDETVNATWSKYVNVDGAWYVTDAPYGVTVTSAAPNKVVNYTATNDINYFFEAESILSRTYGNPNGFYSGGTTAAVYSGATMTMPNIAAGRYIITVNSTVRRANEDKLKVEVSTDGTNWNEAGEIVLTNNVGGDYSIENVVLSADGSIRLVEANSSNMYHYVDYIMLTKMAAATMTVSADAKYGTFCAPFDVTVPSGVTASTAAINANGTTIDLTSVGETISANTPVILYAEEGLAATTFYGKAVSGTPTAGVLTGVYTSTQAEDGWYVLQNNDDVVGFYLVDTKEATPTVGANRCYLTKPAGARVRALYFSNGTVTGINAEAASDDAVEAIYNANGTEVSAMQSGLNIVKMKSGKIQKVLVK